MLILCIAIYNWVCILYNYDSVEAHSCMHLLIQHESDEQYCSFLLNGCSVYCLSDSCLVGRGKTPPVQVVVGSSRMAASHVCTLDNALVGTTKDTTSASCRGSRPSWALVYRSRMQQPNAGSTRARSG